VHTTPRTGGALVFDQISTAFANPDNVAPQSGDDDAVDDDEWAGYINCDEKGVIKLSC